MYIKYQKNMYMYLVIKGEIATFGKEKVLPNFLNYQPFYRENDFLN